MAVITFYKTTIDGENYPDFLEEYLEGCEKKEVTVKAVNPGRESYTIALNDLLPAGMNYAKIEQGRAAFFYKVENLLAPVGDTSYPYVLTLDKFATASYNATLTQSGTGTLLEFNAKNFYGDGTAATGIGQSPVDSAVDMKTISNNGFISGTTNGFFPLIFVRVDGTPGILVPSVRMENSYENGIPQADASAYGRFAAEISRAGKLLRVQLAPTFSTEALDKIEVAAVYIIPAAVWFTLSLQEMVFFPGYGEEAAAFKYELTLDSSTPPKSEAEILPLTSWRLARSFHQAFITISSTFPNEVAIFGGSAQQVQTMPNGNSRSIQMAANATECSFSLVLRDNFGGAVECAQSCRLPLVLYAETRTEEALQTAASVLSAGVSLVGVAGSVATGNPLGIAASVGGLGANVLGAVRQFVQPTPTATSSGASFLDLKGEWCPVFLHTARLARKIDEYGYTPARFLDWKTAPKVPTQHHPVFFHGTVSGAETLLPESWLNDGFSRGVRVWLKSELDNRAEILKL